MKSSLSTAAVNKPQQSKSVKELLLKYIIYWPIFVITIPVSIAVSYVYLKYQSPVYTSYISVYFPEGSKGGSNGADASVLSDVLIFNKKVNLQNEIRLLKTTSVMSRVVQKLKINLVTYKKGKTNLLEQYKSSNIHALALNATDSSGADRVEVIKENDELFQLVGEKKVKIQPETILQGQYIKFQVKINPRSLREGDKYIVEWHPVMSIASQLAWSLNIAQPQTDANILNFSINTQDAQKGIDILNTLVVEYNAMSNEQKDKLVDYTLQFIDERVELMRGELGKVEGGLQRLKQADVLSPDAQSGIGLDELTSAQSKLDDSEVKLQVVNMIRQSLTSPNQPIPTTLGLQDASLQGLAAQYNQAIFQKDEQLRTMPAANPVVRNTQAQIDQIRNSILSNLDNISLNTRQLKQRYQGELSSGRSKLRQVPRQERQLLEISRQQAIKEQLFMYLLQRKEEAAITKASNLSSNSYAVDPAVSGGMISPIPSSIYRTGIIFALLIPALLIYLKELLNDKITTREDVTAKTNIPIVGEVSHSSDKKRRLVVSFDDRSIMGEQFRMMRANIPLLTKSNHKKVVLVTSTTSGEGKTFCSLNLGAVYAVAGKKTVILEMDLRKPKVTEALNIPNSFKGLTHYISDQASLNELPVPISGVPNLFIITAGIIPPNPSEILLDEKIDRLFDYLKANFDFIVIDSAPLGLVSDAKILAKHTDATLYVVRQRITAKKQLIAVNELYVNNVFPNLGLIVNDVKSSGTNSYYGYGGNYMSNYKYSYGNEKQQKTIWQKTKTMIGL